MQSGSTRHAISSALLLVAVMAAAGCSSGPGQYADSKKGWDTPISDDAGDSLRIRLAHTQTDN